MTRHATRSSRKLVLANGKKRRSLVIVAPPFPRVGDTLHESKDNTDWLVLRVEPTEFIALPLMRKRGGLE